MISPDDVVPGSSPFSSTPTGDSTGTDQVPATATSQNATKNKSLAVPPSTITPKTTEQATTSTDQQQQEQEQIRAEEEKSVMPTQPTKDFQTMMAVLNKYRQDRPHDFKTKYPVKVYSQYDQGLGNFVNKMVNSFVSFVLGHAIRSIFRCHYFSESYSSNRNNGLTNTFFYVTIPILFHVPSKIA